MIGHSFTSFLIAIVTLIISYKGFTNRRITDRYCFDVDGVLIHKQYFRLVSSGFLHNGWMHLVFNMIALLAFGDILESTLGVGTFLLIYFAALTGGNLLALFIHKNHGNYTSVGASGAVNGVVFAAIALFPDMGIGLFLIPLSIPAWAFGIAYIIFTIFGVKAKWGNSGHAAHLGGALVGMILTIILFPEVVRYNYLPILCILLPALGFTAFVIYKPEFLLTHSFSPNKKHYSIDTEYNYKKVQEQVDLDTILEKIHRRGISSLTKKEKEALEQYSKTKR